MIEDILLALSEIQRDVPWKNIFLAFTVWVVGQLAFRLVDAGLGVLFKDFKENQSTHNIRKFTIYAFNTLMILLVLKVLRVEMKVVLGAAGFLTLAIGFAARTPISNLISGIFLVFERPFVVGDVIEVNDYRGEVVSINLLSMTMRTLDNLMVRIPNEMVIGSAVRNISFFPIRRLDMTYFLSNKESLTRFEELLMKVAERNELALHEPEPYFHVLEFKENSIHVSFKVWSTASDFSEFRSLFPKEVHRAIKNAGLEPVRESIDILNSESFKDKAPS